MEGFSPYLDKVYDPLMAGSIDGTDEFPHDHAITRAMSASYKPNKRVQGDPHLTLFVSRLSPKTTEDTLFKAFCQLGQIRQYRLVRDIVTGFSKCYGFIEFESEKAVRDAYLEGRNMTIDEKEILVDYEHERTLKNWIPRRLGGGFGGRKESGQIRFGGRDRPFQKPICAAQLKRPADTQQFSGSHGDARKYRSSDRDRREKRDQTNDRSRRDCEANKNDSRRRYRSRSSDRGRY